MSSSGITVGDLHIEWRDDETIQICNTRNGHVAILHGGDFESILSGIVECAVLSIRQASK